MLHTTRSAVDLAKSVFEIVVSDQPGKVVERHRLPRATFLEFFVNRPTATVVMEACGSAHFWARKIESLGHRAVLLPPAQVRPLFDGKRPVAGSSPSSIRSLIIWDTRCGASGWWCRGSATWAAWWHGFSPMTAP